MKSEAKYESGATGKPIRTHLLKDKEVLQYESAVNFLFKTRNLLIYTRAS